MGKGDDRTAEEKAAWDKGKFTPEEAEGTGMTADQMNQQREKDERELGNPLAPPE